MFGKLAFVCSILVSGASLAQMMGGPIATNQYFPLVDGARYDYTFASGPRVSATAIMHAGQTWAGATQLTGMHMTAVCKLATPCSDDTTDFYPDGPRWHALLRW